jgi:hypothetical protein
MNAHLKAAVFLEEHTKDPLLMDAIRVLATNSPEDGVKRHAKLLVESCSRAYIALYGYPNGNELSDFDT